MATNPFLKHATFGDGQALQDNIYIVVSHTYGVSRLSIPSMILYVALSVAVLCVLYNSRGSRRHGVSPLIATNVQERNSDTYFM